MNMINNPFLCAFAFMRLLLHVRFNTLEDFKRDIA